MINFDVKELEFYDKTRDLVTENHSSVKSIKTFPVYEFDNKEYIFKPISKTKPLNTPLFSYSEVFWSYVINKYFNSDAPLYTLAECKGMEKNNPKYYDKGVLVESIAQNGKKLLNLYDYYLSNPDDKVNIKDYENYCMMSYDYTKILESDLFKDEKRRKDVIEEILLSYLREDQNFHYENINLYEDTIEVAPPIDFEFSLPFLFADDDTERMYESVLYEESMLIDKNIDSVKRNNKIIEMLGNYRNWTYNKDNLIYIAENDREEVEDFIEKLDAFTSCLPNIEFNDNNNYITPFNSKSWEMYSALYKENDKEKYEELKSKIVYHELNKEKYFDDLKSHILRYSKRYSDTLKGLVVASKEGIEVTRDTNIEKILESASEKSKTYILK